MSGITKVTNLTSRLSGVFARFCRDRSGATAIEYSMIAAIVSIIILTVLLVLRTTLRDDVYGKIYNAVVNGLSGS